MGLNASQCRDLRDIRQRLTESDKVSPEDLVTNDRPLAVVQSSFQGLYERGLVDGVEVAEETYPIFLTAVTVAGRDALESC